MSDRGGAGGAGVFLLGIAVGAVLGLMFAPGAGENTRAQVARRLRDLRQLAGEKAEDLEALVAGTEDEDAVESGEEETEPTTREDFERRLSAARERRRRRRPPKTERRDDEEDDPVA